MKLILPAVLAAFIASGAETAHAREIVNPDVQQMDLIYRFLAADPPDFSVIARESYEVRTANEFSRANVARQVEDNLRRDYTLMQDVETVRIRTNANFTEYDADQGAYYLQSFAPDTYFPFGNIQVTFENANEFHAWKVPVAEARDILSKAPGRSITLDITFRPFAVDGSRGKRLRGQITNVDIYARRNNNLLASLSIPESEHRQRMIANLPQATTLDASKKEVFGLRANMAVDEIIGWASSAGFSLYSPYSNTRALNSDEVALFAEQLKKDGYPNLFFSSDTRSFEQVKDDYVYGVTHFVGGELYSIFGPQLDCNAPSNLGIKCGTVRLKSTYDDAGNTASATYVYGAILQSAAGMTREQAIALLSEKYGPPADNIQTTIFDNFQTNLLVWGQVQQKNMGKIYFSPVTATQNWEVEAYIVEPDPDRLVVITHINAFELPKGSAASGGGEIKF